MPRKYRDPEQQSSYEREPLVPYRTTNNRPGASTRRSLPPGNWQSDRGLPAMDLKDPRKTECMEVSPTTDFYLDCDDNRSK